MIPTETHAEVPTLTTKSVLTVMGDYLDGSSIHDVIDVQHFHYDGFHRVNPEFNEDMLMTISKILDEEENNESQNTFQNEEGTLKGQVIDSRIA